MLIRINKLTISILLIFLWNNSYGCSVPARGKLWTHDELIEKTDTILLATPVSEDHRFKFKVVEVIKGKSSKEFQWLAFRSKKARESIDFNGHKNPDFWKEGDDKVLIGSAYSAGSYTLHFTFVVGENYLIIEESPGYFHSAEIIKSAGDKWYQNVRSKTNQKKQK